MKCSECHGNGYIHNGVTWMQPDICNECNGNGDIVLDYDYQLRGGKLKVKVIDVETWDVVGIRSDNGGTDRWPLNYFKMYFKEIKED